MSYLTLTCNLPLIFLSLPKILRRISPATVFSAMTSTPSTFAIDCEMFTHSCTWFTMYDDLRPPDPSIFSFMDGNFRLNRNFQYNWRNCVRLHWNVVCFITHLSSFRLILSMAVISTKCRQGPRGGSFMRCGAQAIHPCHEVTLVHSCGNIKDLRTLGSKCSVSAPGL